MTKSAGTALKIQTTASLQDKKTVILLLYFWFCVVTKFQTLVSLALILNSMLEAQ